MSKRKNRDNFGNDGEFIPSEDGDNNQNSDEVKEIEIVSAPETPVEKPIEKKPSITVVTNKTKPIVLIVPVPVPVENPLKKNKRLRNIKPLGGVHFH